MSGNGGYSYFWTAFNKRKSPQISHRAAFDLGSIEDNYLNTNNTSIGNQDYDAKSLIGYFFPVYEVETRNLAGKMLTIVSNMFKNMFR